MQLTLFDEINNLRIEYENMLQMQLKPSQVEVARKYFGTEHVSNTRKFLASMALRLPASTIQELGVIMNMEVPQECLNHESFDSCGAKTATEILSTTDCRIFKSFLTLHSFRMSTRFMNASTESEVQAQHNTLHRACLLYTSDAADD